MQFFQYSEMNACHVEFVIVDNHETCSDQLQVSEPFLRNFPKLNDN